MFALGESFSSEVANDVPPPDGSPQLELHRQAPFKAIMICPALETLLPPPSVSIGEPRALHRRWRAQRREGALPRRALGLSRLVLPPKRHFPGRSGVYPHRPSQLIAAGAVLQEMGRRGGGLHGFRLWSHSLDFASGLTLDFASDLPFLWFRLWSLLQQHGGPDQFI